MRKGIKPPIILNKIFQALDNNVAVLKIVFHNTNKFILFPSNNISKGCYQQRKKK